MSFEGKESADWMAAAEHFRDPQCLVATLRSCGISVDRACALGVRLEPGHGATILFRIPAQAGALDREESYGYVSLRSPDRIVPAFEKSLAKQPVSSPFGPGVVLLQDPPALIYLFPNDRRLTDLRWVSDLTKLKRTLEDLPAPRFERHVMRSRRSRMRIVRYKPERRFIAEVRVCFEDEALGTHFKEHLFLRYFPDDRGERLLDINRQIRASGGQHLVPVGLATRMDGRLYVECLAPGRHALECLEEGLVVDGRKLARALYDFHRCSIPLAQNRSAAEEVSKSLEQLRLLGTAHRGVAEAVDAVADRFAAVRWKSCNEVTLHGDFHLKQILIDSETVTLVDLERCAKGDPRIDLGFFVAQLDALAAERCDQGAALARLKESFLRAYAEWNGQGSLDELDAFTAAATLELAILPFRRMEPEWPGKVLLHLERVRALLAPLGDGGADLRPHTEGPPDPVVSLGLSVIYPTAEEEWPTRIEHGDGSTSYGLFHPRTGEHRVVPLESDAVAAGPFEHLTDLELLSRRVHARAVFAGKWEGKSVIAKAMTRKKARRARELLLLASDLAALSGGSIRVPRILDGADKSSLLILERLDLGGLHQCLCDGSISVNQVQRLARALASWHQVEMPEETPPRDTSVAEGLQTLFARVEPFLRDQRQSIERALSAVPSNFVPTGRAPVHGDLHDKNILLSDHEVSIIDWDGLHPGAPEVDIGNLLGHFYLRGLQNGRGLAFGDRLREVFLRAYGAHDLRLEVQIEWTTILRLVMLYHLRQCADAVRLGLLEFLQQRMPKEWSSP